MRIAVAALALLACGQAFGQESKAMWYQRTDNDVLFGTDRWYTSGMRISRLKDDVEYGIVHEVYTAEAKKWRPGVDDRIPVGRLLFSGAWHDRAESHYRTFELFAGVRGPAAQGEEMTRLIHRIIPAPHVDWSRELENRFDGGMAYVHSHQFGPITAHAGTVLGNQVTHAHAGIEARIGTLPPATAAALRFTATPPMPPRDVHGWSLFAGASVRGVARNELIGRNYDRLGAEIERKRGVLRVAFGGALTNRWGTIEVEVIGDTREFAGQRTPHGYGSLAVHINL